MMGLDLPVRPPSLRSQVIEAIKGVYDPEIPVNLWDLGLIYGVEVDEAGRASARMTLTSAGCPEAELLPLEVEDRVLGVHGVREADVEVVWDPPWSPERLSDAAKLELGLL